MEPYRRARLTAFLTPWDHAATSGFQAVQGQIALGSGGLTGVGIGASVQKAFYLPEAHTDFILAVIGEELGLIGSFVVLGLFVMLAVAGIRTATRTPDPFVRYTAAGIVIWILSQAIINIGMVLGLLPVIGIPLPLLSYGGSSLLVTLVACGILLKCATTEPGAQRALAASKERRKRKRGHRAAKGR
jgi:cell division protein FtsW